MSMQGDVHRDKPQEWSDWNTGAAPEVVDGDWSDAVPICQHCLQEISKLDHYCAKCGFAVGQFTPNIPFVNIPFVCEPFAIMWERLWFPRGENVHRRVLYTALLIIAGVISGFFWIMLIGLLLWWKRPPHQPGHCKGCGYDIRATLERCPECGLLKADS